MVFVIAIIIPWQSSSLSLSSHLCHRHCRPAAVFIIVVFVFVAIVVPATVFIVILVVFVFVAVTLWLSPRLSSHITISVATAIVITLSGWWRLGMTGSW